MALPALAGLFSALKALPSIAGAGTSLIGGAVQGVMSGTVPLDKALTKINTALGPVTDAFNKTAGQASQLVGTFYKLKAGFDTAVGIASKIGGVILSVVGTVASAVKKVVMTAISTAVSAMKFVLSGDIIAQPIRKLASAIDTLNFPVLNVIGSLGKLRDSITAVGGAASQFTELANPAITQRFRFAAEDLTATIGRGLIPILQLATKFTRGFADVIATLSGPLARLQSAFLDPLGDAFDSLVSAMGPVIRTIGRLIDVTAAVFRPFNILYGTLFKIASFGAELYFDISDRLLKPLFLGLTVVASLIGDAAKAFDRMVTLALGRLRLLLGMSPSVGGSSTGAAVRNVGFSNFEEQHNNLIKSAFSLGTASSEDRMANEVTAIKAWLMNDLPTKLRDAAVTMSGAIAQEFLAFIDQVATKIAQSLPGQQTMKDLGAAGVAAGRFLDNLKPGGDSVLTSYLKDLGH